MRILKPLLMLLFGFLGTNTVNAIDYRVNTSFIESCPVTESREYYIPNGTTTYSKGLFDQFRSSEDVYIGDTSIVGVWLSDNSLLSGCDNQSSWRKLSDIAPGSNTYVAAIGANCIFNKPTNNNNRSLQFVYNIKYAKILSTGTSTETKDYYTYNNITDTFTSNSKTYNNYFIDSGNIKTDVTECFNVELRYCGDGIEETSNGERCDDGNNIDGDGCSSTCQLPTPNIRINLGAKNPLDTDGDLTDDTQTIASGTTAGFGVIVENIGTESLDTITLTDIDSPSCAGTLDFTTLQVGTMPVTFSGSGDNTNDILEPGEYFEYDCSSEPVTAGYTNTVSVSAVGVYTNTTVTSTDDTGILSSGITPPLVCTNGGTTGAQTSAISSSTANLCPSGQTVGNFLSSTTGDITSYSWTCDGLTGGTCDANYDNGGGSGPGACRDGGVTGVQATAISELIPNLCITGQSVTSFVQTINGNITSYIWACDGLVGGTCDASYDSSGNGGNPPGVGGGPTYCGDGTVQRPNDSLEMEECDFGSANISCDSSCKYTEYTFPSSGIGELTFPSEGNIYLGPVDNVVIGNGMNPYTAHSLAYPSIKNNSTNYGIYVKELCVIQKEGSNLTGINSPICEGVDRILNQNDNFNFLNYPSITGSISGISGSYGDNKLYTVIGDGNGRYTMIPGQQGLKVRVAKPSISTIGGGTSFVKSTSGISNLEDVAFDPTENKNFVGVGVSDGDLSSYSTKIGKNDITDGDNIDGDYTNIDNIGVNSTAFVTNITDNYNGIDNVFILRDKDFKINSLTNLGNGSKTFIIENGDLIINENITYSDNIAFVVKGGNIIINNSVTSIDGTYISIKKGSDGGKIDGNGGTTLNVLKVNGTLYGNINGLTSKRTYIKSNSSGLIDVGTIVSFGSSIFRKPAPLVATFIAEYIESEKIAK